MGKKSRRTRQNPHNVLSAGSNSVNPPSSNTLPTSINNNNTSALFYPSDGPSDVELLQTTSTSLQAKLDQLTNLGLVQEDRAQFVKEFVPLDLSAADQQAYLQDLTNGPEAEGQWRNLVAEIAAIRSGKGVDRIEGDQIHRAVFYFQHPLLEKCDREVAFVCVQGEWRAEG